MDADTFQDVQQLLLARATYPLLGARLWHSPRTSQRRALANLGLDATALFGGNGSGKTQAVMQLAVATAMGRMHPAAQAWAKANGFPLERLPPRPGRVWVSALTWDDGVRYHRPALDALLPKGSRWTNREGLGPAKVALPGGGVIICKANQQGRELYQGDVADLIILDEEHDEAVYRECLERVGRVKWGGGHVVLSMTPLKGLTWPYYTFEAPDTQERSDAIAQGRVRMHRLHGLDNPHVARAKLAAIRAGYSEDERRARERGEFVSREGLVYTAFDRGVHVRRCPHDTLPEGWRVVWGLDFGFSNPLAVVVCWVDPRDDVWWVRAEYSCPGRTLEAHAREFARLAREHGQPELIAADPEDAQSRQELAKLGWVTHRAVKAVTAGVNSVAVRLEPDAGGHRHLFIDPSCRVLILQLGGLRWKPGARDAVVKVDDHLPDALRYAVHTDAASRVSVA